jgi:hypothetical protein
LVSVDVGTHEGSGIEIVHIKAFIDASRG